MIQNSTNNPITSRYSRYKNKTIKFKEISKESYNGFEFWTTGKKTKFSLPKREKVGHSKCEL